MQDFEFTIQDGKLFMLQTRNGKRTGLAAVRIRRRHGEGKTDRLEEAAIRRVPADQLDQLLAPIFDRDGSQGTPKIIATGLARRPGRGFRQDRTSTPTAPSARRTAARKVLLVRIETSPEDLRGMIAAEGILTARGGVSSHAALVARQMGKVCVCGAAGARRLITTKAR